MEVLQSLQIPGTDMGSFPVLTKVVLARTRTRTRVFEQGHKRTPGMAPRAYVQNFRSSGYGYDCRTSVELSVRVIPGVNTPGMVLYVPYRTLPRIFRHLFFLHFFEIFLIFGAWILKFRRKRKKRLFNSLAGTHWTRMKKLRYLGGKRVICVVVLYW